MVAEVAEDIARRSAALRDRMVGVIEQQVTVLEGSPATMPPHPANQNVSHVAWRVEERTSREFPSVCLHLRQSRKPPFQVSCVAVRPRVSPHPHDPASRSGADMIPGQDIPFPVWPGRRSRANPFLGWRDFIRSPSQNFAFWETSAIRDLNLR